MGSASPSVVSQIVQRNSQLFRSKRVTYQIRYLVTADEPGDYQVGPFLIKQGKKQARAHALPMSFRAVPDDPNMRIRLILPDRPIYPDQRVPVKIEWWYAGDFEDVLKLSIYSPIFDQFRFGPDAQPSRRAALLPIDTKDGRVSLAATARDETDEGRQFVVVSATRTLIPDRVGEFSLTPATATLRRATEWARSRSPFDDFDDMFGGSLLRDMIGERRRRPSRTALVRAVGEAKTITVEPFPLAGRPASFAGAVGQGFSIDVTADRTVVRVGDPIALNVTLRGDGNIENVSLPSLSADGGLNPNLFRLPEGDVPGTITDGTKNFRVSVRVSDESVAEIPALAYSWFDPTTESYHTARSKPIALRVMPAQVISAEDVVRQVEPATSNGQDLQTAGDTIPGHRNPSDSAMATTNRPVFSLSGADLAIEREPKVVLRDSGGMFTKSTVLPMTIYSVGFLLVVVALCERRRRSIDPELAIRRKTARKQQARIARAADLAPREAAEEIAAALRIMMSEVPDVPRDEAQAVIASCESIAYAPGADGEVRLDNTLVERAKKVAEV
jgi:hypothetical protein